MVGDGRRRVVENERKVALWERKEYTQQILGMDELQLHATRVAEE